MSNKFDGIQIECKDPDFEERIIDALNLLKRDAKATDYAVVKNDLDKIKQHDASYVIPGESPITFYISRLTAFSPYYDKDNALFWCASAIAHDAYHSKLYKESPYKAIEDYTGREAERQCCEFQLKVCEDIKASKDIIGYMNDLIRDIKNGTADYWSNPNRGYAIRDSKILITLIENGQVDLKDRNIQYAITLSQCLPPRT
jgi:hypothetical protein